MMQGVTLVGLGQERFNIWQTYWLSQSARIYEDPERHVI